VLFHTARLLLITWTVGGAVLVLLAVRLAERDAALALTAHAPNDVLDEVIAIATTAMYAARRNGGNQASYVVDPPLTVLDHPDGANGHHA
jgi:hypothetical protein